MTHFEQKEHQFLHHVNEMRLHTAQVRESSYAAAVLRFMVFFDQLPVPKEDPIPAEDFALAERLISEEVGKEFYPAFNRFREDQSLENLTALVDGAIDSIYVILWLLNKLNVPIDACFDEVQRSNMAKLNSDGTYSKTEFGKVKKPAHWTPPDLFSILRDHFDPAAWKNGVRQS